MVERLVLVSLSLALLACGSEARDAEGLEAEPVVEVPRERVELPGPPPIYDAEGNLLESEDRVAGLVLPVSLESVIDEDRRHVYRSEVPIARVLRYFGPRLMTGQVDPSAGGGATYRDALPRDATGSAVHLDVSITPIPGGTRIEIEELLPAPPTPPTEREAMDDLARRMRESE